MMKLLCISILLLIFFMIIGIDSVRDNIRIQSMTGELTVKEHSLPQISSSNNKERLVEAYILMHTFTLGKQLDLQEDSESFFSSHYKALHTFPCSLQERLHQENCPGDFIRFLSERHQDGFYIYSLRKLIV